MSLVRVLCIVLGSVSLVLGIIGAFVPLLPTTPFLLLTAFLYMKGSQRCYDWLMNQPVLGKYIRDYRENKIIPLRAKIMSLTLLWISMSYCIIYAVSLWPVKGLLAVIAAGVTIHILSFKSR
jgi:uncharacterized membrane protein YbaN (DUF454 family)